MTKRFAVFILFLIIECSTFSEYVKDFFGEVISCSLDICEGDGNECENENQENKNEPNKYLISFFELNFTFDVFQTEKSTYLDTKSSERFPYRFIQSPPPKA
ncbi:hypothetical protein [Emticicia sp. TH156]|uniref:hypothetical protein n=1 Tax=Emticicia sp. TH156 TaxID=2067454 RepID=UPI0011808A58|nr:hypothetical protein [Emticicia sp. TH156]